MTSNPTAEAMQMQNTIWVRSSQYFIRVNIAWIKCEDIPFQILLNEDDAAWKRLVNSEPRRDEKKLAVLLNSIPRNFGNPTEITQPQPYQLQL